MNQKVSSLCFILFFTIFGTCLGVVELQPSIDNPITGLLCGLIDCVHGTCFETNATFPSLEPPVDCKCDPGWKQFQAGPITLPPCILPNCTLNFGCGTPSPPALPPPLNLTDPCGLVWCGEGTCIVAGDAGHICQCNEGADNLFGNKDLPCFKECVFGADCSNFGLGNQAPPPPSSANRNGTSSSPPPSSGVPYSKEHGPGGAPNSSRTLHSFTMFIVAAIVIALF